MRITSVVTSVSWIPSEAIAGLMRLPMDIGLGHYDPPPPDTVVDSVLDRLRATDALRAANRLVGWIEVDEDRIIDAGYSGRAVVGSTTARLGPALITFPAVAYPVLREDPVIEGGVARFVQTVGARTGVPLPRRVDHRPYLRITGPTTWVTLALEIGIDGSVRHEVVGASPFPRHWIYDHTGRLVAKSGVIDWSEWTRVYDHERSPWHGFEREVTIAEAATPIERAVSNQLMRLSPVVRTIELGNPLTVQGEPGTEIYLVLDGMLDVDVDGRVVAEIGPGAIVGERAVLGDGVRTSTVRATTRGKVAVVDAGELDQTSLAAVATHHRRENG